MRAAQSDYNDQVWDVQDSGEQNLECNGIAHARAIAFYGTLEDRIIDRIN